MAEAVGMHTGTLLWYDTWRFWESLAAGCVTVQVPLLPGGAILPVMPEPGLHYAPFSGHESKRAFLRNWESVREAGVARQWAIDHYGPVAQANRLLEYVADLKRFE